MIVGGCTSNCKVEHFANQKEAALNDSKAP
uniref:Uncharacterized protein n=1 Tax=Physcomitrium patens TaxID=3218 RepID=A0A2K1L000_PHYPA|nr:hypothetical protein PHYPA_002145 [Physcomitrium patens]